MNAEYQRLEAQASEVQDQMWDYSQNASLDSAREHTKFEREIVQLGRKLAALHQGMALLKAAGSPKMRQREREFIQALPKRFHSQGSRPQTVQLGMGVTVRLSVTYYHRCQVPNASQRGRRGLFPLLMLLGISEGFGPHARSRMVKAAALLGSFEEAAMMLVEEGFDVSVNKLRKVTAGMGEVLAKLTAQGPVSIVGEASTRRIVVTTDGGRVRLREPCRGKTKKGRKRFKARWREPRLFMIYAVDDEGRLADDFPPIIDGTLGSCDALFALMLAYLKGLNITQAQRVLFVADGASWIWKRVPGLLKSLGLKTEQTQELIDFWHAVEYLSKIAESKKLTGANKKRWLKTQKNRLLRGEIGSVVEELKSLIGKRATQDQRTWLNYFVTHGLTHRRMDYSRAKSHQLPIGSGAIESAVRRVINLRVKSNSVYWLRENAEAMIRLRAWQKAGRADELFEKTTCVNPKLVL